MLVAAVSGCRSSLAAPPVAVPLPAAPEPAVSPAAQGSLPGTVVPLNGGPEGVAVDADGVVAVNIREPDAVVLFPIADPSSRRTIALGGSARHLMLAAPDGPLLVPDESDDTLVELGLPQGQVEEKVAVGRQPHDAIALGAHILFVADELGNTVHIIQGGRVVRVVAAPLQPGGMAANLAGTLALVVGVRGRRITEYRSDGTVVGSANCGAGPTHAVTGDGGLYWVAFDTQRDTLWVTVTGANQLLGLHLNGRRVVDRTVYATVRQPNTVAVDQASGELVVTGSTPSGQLQLLAAP
jgi:outer membrane protein assembly factor BamB